MNIFYLDKDLTKCAQYLVDRHVTKMQTEGCQVLCTVLRLNDINYGYKITHLHHPCVKWAGANLAHFLWLKTLSLKICDEYSFRYEREHAVEKILRAMPTPPLPVLSWTPPPQCMPDIYKDQDTISAYRNYYKLGKAHLHKWKKRPIPDWVL